MECLMCYAAVGLVLLVAALGYFVQDGTAKFELKNRRVLVTGGYQGIGLAVVTGLIKKGAKVCMVARNSKKLKAAAEQLKKDHGVDVGYVSADVSDAKAIADATAQAAGKLGGGIDALVHCAGVAAPGLFEDLPLDTFEWMMKVNFLGTVYTTRAVVPYLKEAGGGRLILVSSLGGLSSVAGYTAYSPSKAAIKSFAEALHMELRPHNIYTSVAVPPDVDTPGYAEENKTKPVECKRISDGVGVFQPEEIATDIISGLENWSFMIATGFDGVLSASLCAGMAPASSLIRTVLEVPFLGIVRLVGLFYLKSFNDICVDEHKKRNKPQ